MIELPLDPANGIILPIRISGPEHTREIDALLDTGASYLVIPTEDAIDLGYDLALSPRFPAVTANGIVEAPLILLRSVRLGPYCINEVPAMALNMAGDRISSLLGLSFLCHFDVGLNLKSGNLLIEDC